MRVYHTDLYDDGVYVIVTYLKMTVEVFVYGLIMPALAYFIA